MKVFRIYKLEISSEYNYRTDDYEDIENDITIKYVDSKEKVNEFLNKTEKSNESAKKCYHCPLLGLSKRQYNSEKYNMLINTYCNDKDIMFDGNSVLCNNFKYMNLTQYNCEEVNVE